MQQLIHRTSAAVIPHLAGDFHPEGFQHLHNPTDKQPALVQQQHFGVLQAAIRLEVDALVGLDLKLDDHLIAVTFAGGMQLQIATHGFRQALGDIQAEPSGHLRGIHTGEGTEQFGLVRQDFAAAIVDEFESQLPLLRTHMLKQHLAP